MAVPVVNSYSMPDRSAVPASGPPWTIDPARAALLVHDMQNHFVQAFPPDCSPVVELIDNIATLRELAGTLGMPIVFSTEPAERPGGQGLLTDSWVPAGGPESGEDSAVVSSLTPRVGEHLLVNVRHNAFLRSHLGRLLRSEGRDQLILCGVRAHLGILLTAADAFMHDIQPFVVADAVADLSSEDHSMALRWIARTGVVCTTNELIRHLLHGRAAQSM
ncbi:isochorismatase family protein [Streptomyces sp. Qhu-G9]|uniref:isochorismatase family protein n=1 Tax=Streptomyces sp. Qhu-G9 TaxID=3452799 RepID=UPI0022AC6862|nr:isochorismatase family protein [Streptomyces aurantiacus]WAU83785.1 isochorismatase family protein [Streptomyces aurantiacus]